MYIATEFCCHNPADCREAHQLYQYAQSLGDLSTGEEEDKEGVGNTSFTDSMAS